MKTSGSDTLIDIGPALALSRLPPVQRRRVLAVAASLEAPQHAQDGAGVAGLLVAAAVALIAFACL